MQVSELSKNFYTNRKALKNNTVDSFEYAKAMDSLKKSMADVLNIDADTLSDDFITNNLEKIDGENLYEKYRELISKFENT